MAVMVAVSANAYAAGTCGDAVTSGPEECDPGGALHVNGDPTLATCTTGSNCFFVMSCCKFNCQYVGQGAPCADGNDCTTTDHCDQVGQCIGSFEPNGESCDDGVFCNGADTCQTGECAGHAGDPCAGNTNCVATCDEGANQCTSTPFVPCTDDGNACTDDVCDGGAVCTHPALPGGTVCRAQATACDVAEQCGGGGAPCPADTFIPNGTSCGDQCTTGGTCQSGQCAGGSPLVCDDDDVCNGLETCDSLTGCVLGQPLDCSDGNGCTSDVCAPIGGCSNPVVPDGSGCDDGERCTLSDACAGGTCIGADVQMIALQNARFGTLTVGSGNVAVNDAKGFVKFSRAALMVDGSLVTANSVTLSALASLDDVEANKRQGPGIVRGSLTPVTLPLGLSCASASANCGGASVTVPETAVVRITPGTYGDVKIGRRGTLELDPGEYDFCSLKTFPPAAFRPRGDVVVRIAKDLKTSRLAIFEPYVGVTQVFVGGKAKFGPESVITRMAFSAPAGPFQLSRTSTFDGAVCAQKIKGQKAVHFGCPLP
ncbi:MAG: hypothetical protein ABIR79_04390 [Candidatus Binatia bacterium]